MKSIGLLMLKLPLVLLLSPVEGSVILKVPAGIVTVSTPAALRAAVMASRSEQPLSHVPS
jgi:hypothetical protein